MGSSANSDKFKSSVMSLNCSENDLAAINDEVSGYIGILDDTQTIRLAELWSLLLDVLSAPQAYLRHSTIVNFIKKLGLVEKKTTEKEVTIKDIETEFWLACHGLSPDAFLLRFLRARKFEVYDAFYMLFSSLHWRITYGVQSVIEKGESQLEHTQFEGKTFLYRYDQHQRPVMYINVKHHIRGSHSQDQLELFTVYMIETARLFLSNPQGKVTIVFNMEGFSMQNMDYPVVKFLISTLQSYYPESLGLCLIVNAPWLFQGVWKVIKGYLDPVVQSKIVFVKANQLDKWLIPEFIPSGLSTSSEGYVFQYTPSTSTSTSPSTSSPTTSSTTQLSEELLDKYLKACRQYIQLTQPWIQHWTSLKSNEDKKSSPSKPSLTTDGSIDTSKDPEKNTPSVVEQRNQCVNTLMRPAFIAYDAQIRMPSYWHRIGVINHEGTLDWNRLDPCTSPSS
ncbi:hypothetical protein HMI54_006665 [Coelomomyces lativittatus]|nr:hypothetical protein HMI56_005469 [Coelomomyces lativittatus]KAJ1517181.1 hypothetical protein HMI54_006665 [Coelomomyces lativittatus]KAJ1517961.1 hypothetical protein HMI55_004495 [Coelomomyces lativittatus]